MKKSLSIILSCIFVIGMISTASAESLSKADKLNQLGLLSNVTENALNQTLTRDIGVTMIIKSLGYSVEEAAAMSDSCTFTDMGESAWAKGYVAIAYDLNITVGKVDGVTFDPKGVMTQHEFLTFQLRALGYDLFEAWTKADEFAVATGLADGLNDNTFIKRDASEIMYNALSAELQDVAEGKTLLAKLIEEGVVDAELADEVMNAEDNNGGYANSDDFVIEDGLLLL